MRKNLLLVCLIIITAPVYSQESKNFAGDWEGILNAGAELHIVFHIKANGNGSLSASADSPDQSAYGLKCDTVFVSAESIIIKMDNLNASFTGKLINDSTINGNFTQGRDLPLILKRKNKNPAQATTAAQVAPSYYTITEVSIKQKGVTLYGTLFQPTANKTSPVVLIIAGSGPTDRDGNNPLLPGKNNSLLQLADSLAQHGIASLRYDKRGVGKSQPEGIVQEADLTINDIAGDAKAMYGWLKANGYKDIFIAGHSEGSLIGLMISPQLMPKGFISIAGAGRKSADLLKEQINGSDQLSSEQKIEVDKDIDSLEHGFTVTKGDPSLMNILRPSIQPYMKSWLPLDPPKLAGTLKCPVLVIQGTNDLQVKEKDAQAIYKAAKKGEIKIIPNMNHVLKEVASRDKNDNTKAYSDPALPVMQLLITTIVNFILPK